MTRQLDDLDLAIVAELQHDGRTSNREVARRVDVSEGTVRARLRRLESEDLVRFLAVTDPVRLGVTCVAYICLEVDHRASAQVAAALREFPEFTFVARTLGRFNVMGLVALRNRAELSQLLSDRVLRLPGVRRSETLETLRTFKHDHRWVRFVSDE